MHRLILPYYFMVLALFGYGWQQGYAISSLFAATQHEQSGTGNHTYHK